MTAREWWRKYWWTMALTAVVCIVIGFMFGRFDWDVAIDAIALVNPNAIAAPAVPAPSAPAPYAEVVHNGTTYTFAGPGDYTLDDGSIAHVE
jgi:hypothetical protein